MTEILSITEEDNRPKRQSTSEIGSRGERLAAEFLSREGFRIVLANFTAPIGRNNNGAQVKGEIDLIALDDDVLCFIEVKTRRSAEFTGPLTNVDVHKQRLITRTARVYRRIFGVRGMKYRYDVVTVIDSERGITEIELFKSYWTESKFKKMVWANEFM